MQKTSTNTPVQHHSARAISRLSALAACALAYCSLPNTSLAVSDADATTAYNAFNSTFLISGNSNNGYHTTIGNNSWSYFWEQAAAIEVAEDRYERTRSAANKTTVQNLLIKFLNTYPEPWDWNVWNDDLGRVSEMLARGYLQTGYADALTRAKYGVNLAYGRGWDTVYNGGGIWEKMDDKDGKGKEYLSTGNCGYAYAVIHVANGDQTYRSRAGNIYAWIRGNLFNTANGQVYSAIFKDGSKNFSSQVGNQGTHTDYGRLLYNISGNSTYLTDAKNSVIYTKANHTDSSGFIDSCAGQFARGLGHLVVDNNMWNDTFSSGTTYYSWMWNNCNTGWGNRWTTYNVSWNQIANPTPHDTTLKPLQCAGVPSLLQYTFMPH